MRAIVWSGGGAAGVFQVGVKLQLTKLGFKPDRLYGSSVGAVNSAIHSYYGDDEMLDFWHDLKGRKSVLSYDWKHLPPFRYGLFNLNPLRKLVDQYVLDQSDIHTEAIVCSVDLVTGAKVYTSNKRVSPEAFREAVIASAAMPFLMSPAQCYRVDGGVREITPLGRAIEDGCDDIVAIVCAPYVKNPINQWHPKWPEVFSIGMRSFELALHEIFMNDIEMCLLKNEIPRFKNVKLTLYAPPHEVVGVTEFTPEAVQKGIKLGLEAKPVIENGVLQK